MENMTVKEIRLLTFKMLMRVLKNHKVYPIFRSFIKYNNKFDIYKNLNIRSINIFNAKISNMGGENPFIYAQNVNDILSIMESLEKQMMNGHNRGDKNLKTQNLVMFHTNNLLHFCVERGVKDIRIMGVLGKEAFELTCKKILGDDFVDETEQPNNEDEPMVREKPMSRAEGIRQFLDEMKRVNGNENNDFLDTLLDTAREGRLRREDFRDFPPFVPSFMPTFMNSDYDRVPEVPNPYDYNFYDEEDYSLYDDDEDEYDD